MRHCVSGLLSFLVVCQLQACDRPDVRFPQFVRDQIVAWGILGGLDQLVDQNLSGRPAGEQDITSDCPEGGSIHISGTVSQPGAVVDLSCDLSGCVLERSTTDGSVSASLALTGSLTYKLSINATTGYGSEELESEQLEMIGWEYNAPEEADVDQTCALSIGVVESETSGAIMAKLCKRHRSWSYYHSACNW